LRGSRAAKDLIEVRSYIPLVLDESHSVLVYAFLFAQIAVCDKEPMMMPRMVSVTGVKEWHEGELRPLDDYLVGEEPLEIRVGDIAVSVTMRTPGHELELATGFLFTEGLIADRNQIASVRHEPDAKQDGANRVRVDLAPGVVLDPEASRRNFYTTSSCGVCGKASIDAVRVRRIERPNRRCAIDPEVLCRMPDQLRAEQAIFGRTGGLHAAGLFSLNGELLVLREDVGRHNAVDKVIGWALANDLIPLRDSLLMVSGRGGFEIIQKALVAGIPVLASVSAPSDLAVNLAREYGMTLIGFLRGRRFVIYSGAERLATGASL
jgi:FdhD protein